MTCTAAIARRHEFVLYFDVATAIRTAIPTLATCRAWTRRPATAWSAMSA